MHIAGTRKNMRPMRPPLLRQRPIFERPNKHIDILFIPGQRVVHLANIARGILKDMDPFTHLMTGACLARAGFNRKAAYAAAAMTIAAELPDIDTLWSAAGPVAAFQHHRGITHTFLGLPFEAAAVVAAAWLWHRWRTTKPPVVAAPANIAQKNRPPPSAGRSSTSSSSSRSSAISPSTGQTTTASAPSSPSTPAGTPVPSSSSLSP